MKIAYLMHYLGEDYEEVSENIDQILEGGDHVFVMLNDEKLRDDIFIAYASVPECHVSTVQSAALHGDLSLPRGTILQMKDALEYEEDADADFDYFINLTDGMLPVRSRQEIVQVLEQLDGRDNYIVTADSETSEDLKKRMEEYAFFTNSLNFQKSKMLQGMNSFTKNIVKNFKNRETDDVVVQTWPFFVLGHDSAEALVDNLAYCSNQFMMCLYPEELCFGTMLRKFSPAQHEERRLWITGQGDYQEQAVIQPVTMDQVLENPEALFAVRVKAKENLPVYQNVFDAYNS
ncbi:beta-1,6-N-acetylglucosaminyltransferase [Faecalibaculum rodentium]|uniref:beta-1,6-N-acetylglucosaminyltransferase n=1 Tax=Faecalibaculum rodentium TaxID=1702221 RepID=UPI0026312E71|nr:beta-1,6-N-acetylglucosaminyltransferase [Faecalibaculum rodentium]